MSPEVLIALIGVTGTLLGSIIAGVLTNRAAQQREDFRWERELEERRRQERYDICEAFLTTLSNLEALFHDRDTFFSSPSTDEWDKGWEDFDKSLIRLQLRTSKALSDAAEELPSTYQERINMELDQQFESNEEKRKQLEELYEKVREQTETFRGLARADAG